VLGGHLESVHPTWEEATMSAGDLAHERASVPPYYLLPPIVSHLLQLKYLPF